MAGLSAGMHALVEVPHFVGPDARGVDHDPCSNAELGAVPFEFGAHQGAVGPPVVACREPDHGGVVGDGCTEFAGRGARQGKGQARVVGSGVEVDEPGDEVVGVERRQVGQCLFPGEAPMVVADAPAAGDVVGPQHTGVGPGYRPRRHTVTPEERDEERQRRDEVRRVVEQALPFGEVLVHEAELALLEVAQPPVHELRGLR